ncbi:hypothetical protein ACR9E3_25500 [Actinomycetospora sp. C-140]
MQPRVPLSAAVAPARETHREAIDAFVAWSTAFGRPADPDIAALIHAAQDREGERDGWDRAGFFAFYGRRIGNWCAIAGCEYPFEEIPETLWLWLHHRDLSGGWGPGDEPLHDLLKVLYCYGNIGFDGRRQPDGERTRRLVPCECFVSRRYPLPDGPPPTVDDLDRELEEELGRVPRRHGSARSG